MVLYHPLRTIQRNFSNSYTTFHEGQFRFEELLSHLDAYKAAKFVAISEDATRIISKIEYDNETNKAGWFCFALQC